MSGKSIATKKAASKKLPFWKTKTMKETTKREWESLCDGCGRCCLNKFEDEDTKEIFYTNVACRLFNINTCRCSNYPERTKYVKDCVVLTPKVMSDMNCLPPTCGYRLIHEGKDLYDWHPLVSGRKSSVHEAGISAKGRAISEASIEEEDLENHIVKWPMTKRSKKI
jgi:uncharacterized cysteine cluster protein YcgN (CxxCxxCC family)